jgi:hypothetical protein
VAIEQIDLRAVRAALKDAPIKVRADADQVIAARLGIIIHDDAIEVLQAEFSEDYLRLAGTGAAAMERRTPAQVARPRLPWLWGPWSSTCAPGWSPAST